MRKRSTALVLIAVALAVSLVTAACSKDNGSSNSGDGGGGAALTGAGATFPEPIYTQWFSDFDTLTGEQINYQAIGSGGGVEQFTGQTVDFGASDAPLTGDEVAALPAGAVEIPTVVGGVAVAYNVSGVEDGLKLDGATTAKIFLGTITKWNDPAITDQNPGVDLPNADIAVVHRSDESGTTKVFTSWLSSQSSEWKSQVGADKAVEWPVGTGGDGNDGVAAGMSQTEGSIGYLSYDFAVTSGFGSAAIKRADGAYVSPSVDSISKAAAALKLPITEDTSILNSTASGAYPISTTTYLLIYKDQTDASKGQTLVDFVYWALTKGQEEVPQLNYAPLPKSIATKALETLATITSNGTPIQPSSTVKT
ncbi:MAG: phosphate ABC transporter substrate-binding protein PstS [Actinomycetota bacterium]|nr:phosphate ABC transporter substrate-binding protein PstS [Actinomycetota bacterium]